MVAAQNIPRGTPITEENLAVRLALWPEDAMPSGALYDLESTYGRIARVDIVLNMPITEGMLTNDAGDAVTHTAEYKVCAVKGEKAA